MKKLLLPVCLLITGITNAQTLSQANEPSTGTSATMFLCDSFATTYENVTGPTVTWDYSVLPGYNFTTRTIDIEDASGSPYISDFTGATKTFNMQNSMTTFFSSTLTERSSQGFVYVEPTFGTIIAKYNTDNEILMTYPFAYGDSQMDNYSGTLNYTYSGFPQSKALTGVVHSSVDGKGTLLLNGTTFNDVIRYKIVDTSLVPDNMIIGDLELIKIQYEYYNLTTTNMPLLILSKFIIQAPGSANPLTEASIVLSSVAPSESVGIAQLDEKKFEMYPNPVIDNLTITGDFSNNATASIYDQSGRLLQTLEVMNNTIIDLSSYEKGMYIVELNDGNNKSSQKFIKR